VGFADPASRTPASAADPPLKPALTPFLRSRMNERARLHGGRVPKYECQYRTIGESFK